MRRSFILNARTCSASAMSCCMFGVHWLTMLPLVRAGMTFLAASRAALAADTASITVMEIVDNAIMVLIPGAMNAGLNTLHFWRSLTAALAIAWIVAYPVNRWLIARGLGHAKVHAHHH